MYRTSPVIVENKPLQGEARRLRCASACVLFVLSGLIFPIMTGVLYIIPYIYIKLSKPSNKCVQSYIYIKKNLGLNRARAHNYS